MSSPGADPAGAIVFTDIVGFTELTDVHGDDLAIAVVERQLELVREVLPERARIVKELGDGLLLWFDDPVEAVDAATTSSVATSTSPRGSPVSRAPARSSAPSSSSPRSAAPTPCPRRPSSRSGRCS
jgi:class 3 adenylate cyclase